MAKRVGEENERLKTVKDGIPYIGCSGCRTVIKTGFLNPDVMALPERITEADWKGTTPMYCKNCLAKRK